MLGSIVEDHRTIDLDVKWHGEFDGATLKGRYSTGKKLRTKARDTPSRSAVEESTTVVGCSGETRLTQGSNGGRSVSSGAVC